MCLYLACSFMCCVFLCVVPPGKNPFAVQLNNNNNNNNNNSVASVRKRTIPTERPLLVSEVSANFLRIEGNNSIQFYLFMYKT
jgi:hypothetical protein